MSRVCVKGIPSYLSEDRLKEHFSEKGEVTDVKIIRTSDGRSRQFAFVGYRTEQEASSAVSYFDRSFIDTSRLTCEIARPIGGQTDLRPWSRYSKGSSAYNKSHKALEGEKLSVVKRECEGSSGKDDQDSNEDPEFADFLQAMQPRSKSKLWANDTMAGREQEGRSSTKGRKDKKDKQLKTKSLELNGSRQAQDKPTSGAKGSPSSINGKVKGKHMSKQLSFENGKEEAEAKVGGLTDSEILPTGAHNIARDETVSDLDYLKQRTKENWSDDDEQVEPFDDDSENLSEAENERSLHLKDEMDNAMVDDPYRCLDGAVNNLDVRNSHAEEFIAEQQESVAETGRLFVRNLSYTTSEEDLQELFSQFGQLSEVHLVLDKETKCSKGFAYVLYMLPESAVRAIKALDSSTFQGRILHILPAKRPPAVSEKDLKTNAKAPGSNQFKQDREAQRRAAEAGGNTQAWNALFMRSDTVAENVARRYGLSKSDLLNPEAEDLAVRLALGETQIIAETKKALSDEGVNVEVLEDMATGKLDNVKRSNRVILVKNLPFSTSETDLAMMFGKFGSIERVILPPTKTLAMVVYLEASEARAAVKGLAYKRFKHVPLYLEWAPENILSVKLKKQAYGVDKQSCIAIGEDQVKRAVLEQQLTAATNTDADYDLNESRSVFIKNLNFSTSETVLKKHLQKNLKEGALRSVTIKMKRGKDGKKKDGKLLSMGFGFAEFDSQETARSVCQQLQGSVLDGHALVLQLSRMKDITTVKKSADINESSTKLIVRNVAFEATKKDLQQLFSPFGQIKSLRLPRKFDGNHRGFAFLEFLTKQEAMNAYNALASTHLYGRHLVIEKAKESESLDDLRARTASQYSEGAGQLYGSGRPTKKRQIDDGDTRFTKVAH